MNMPGVDFLDRLVGKARGEDSGLQPRLPSFFEPTRHVRLGPPMDPEFGELIEERTVEARRPARHGEVRVVDPVATVTEARSDETAIPRARRIPEPIAAPLTASETSPTAPVTAMPAERPRRTREAPAAPEDDDLAPAARLRPSSAVLAAAAVEAIPNRDRVVVPPEPAEAPALPRASTPIPAEPPRRAIVEARGPDSRPIVHLTTTVGVLVPSAPSAVSAVVTDAQAARRRDTPEPLRVERPTADEAPVVNVTIGRIEVRAVTAPTAPTPRRREGPQPMSLAEYLERRGAAR